MKYLKYLPYIGTLAFIILLFINLKSCGGGKTKEVVVTRIDTILQVRIDSFIKEIPIPVEKKIYVEVKADTNTDSLQSMYVNRINSLQKSIVEYQNALAAIKDGEVEEPIEITANMYYDTLTGEDYTLGIAVGVIGHMESFDYFLDQFEKVPPPCPDCPKKKNNFISLGMGLSAQGQWQPTLGFGHKIFYWRFGYGLTEPHGFNNLYAEQGLLFRF